MLTHLPFSISVLSSRLNGVYCSRDKAFPNQKRKIWETERYCACPNPHCDHCYPHCLNDQGGLCIECMVHDEKWDRLSHEQSLGGLGADPPRAVVDAATAAAAAINADPMMESGFGGSTGAAAKHEAPAAPYIPHIDFEFSLRLSPTLESAVLTPGHFFLTVEAAVEHVTRAQRRQRRLEGEEEVHTTAYSIWIEERTVKGPPQLGNEARVQEAAERLAERAKLAERKKQFGLKVDQYVDKEREKARAEEEKQDRR
jgi:hypothetical protein